ncbi:MAG: MFS transporter [Firmicutes bacterium HGW-Firmicutes-2]|jgi:MFS family permease|nr:MAG: MFS transporter [Firmicutes bacterium HGW-Firmicutes-2]
MDIRKKSNKSNNINISSHERFNLYLFTSGKAVSILGSSIYTFAIGLYVLKITGSAQSYATTLMLSILPLVVMSPIAGVIADRIPKKWLVVGMDFLSGLLFTALYFYSIKMTLNLAVIYISTVLLNIFTTFFGIGMEAAKPSLVTSARLIKLNSLSKLIDSSASILGPIVGGMVFALVDIHLFILFNAVSFIFSAVTEWFIDYELNEEKVENKEKEEKENKEKSRKNTKEFLKDLKEGWDFFSHNRSILELFFVFVSLNFLLGFSVNVPAPYIINQLLKMPSTSFGMINSMFPVGLILGTLTVEKIMKRIEFRRLLISMNAFIALLAGLIGLPVIMNLTNSNNLIFYGIIYMLMGIGIAYVDVPLMTILQNDIPKKLLGRVLSLIMSLVKVVLPIAIITSGLLINRLPIVIIPMIGASIAFSYSIFLLIRLKDKKIKTDELLV